jgi:hypothetical protein
MSGVEHFPRVEGPGRCSTCCWHIQTQGHHLQCPGGVETPDTPAPDQTCICGECGEFWIDKILAEKAAEKAAERAAELLHPSKPYMAYRYLLPPPPENPSLADEYVRCAKIFARANRSGVRMLHLFNPSTAQREDNIRRALAWHEQRRTKGSVAPWAATAFNDEIDAVATCPKGGGPKGGRNNQLFASACNLYEIVEAGALDEHDVYDALREAMRTNGYERDKGESAVTATIAQARGRVSPRDLSGVYGGIR